MVTDPKCMKTYAQKIKIKERQNPNRMVKTTTSSALQPEKEGVGKIR